MSTIKNSPRKLVSEIIYVCERLNVEPNGAIVILLVRENMIGDLIKFHNYQDGTGKPVERWRNVNGSVRKVFLHHRILREEIDDWIERGLIESHVERDEDLNFFDIKLTKKTLNIINEIFETETSEYGIQFWNLYPETAVGPQDRRYPLMNTDKTDFINLYENQVSEEEHKKKVMPWLRAAKRNNEVSCKITVTLANKPWEKWTPKRSSRTKIS